MSGKIVQNSQSENRNGKCAYKLPLLFGLHEVYINEGGRIFIYLLTARGPKTTVQFMFYPGFDLLRGNKRVHDCR